MAVSPFALPQESGILIEAGTAPQVFFHGVTCEAHGGEVFLRFRVGGADGLSFYPIHLQDGESRADPPFSEGVVIAGDLYIEVTGGAFLVGGAVFARTGS